MIPVLLALLLSGMPVLGPVLFPFLVVAIVRVLWATVVVLPP